MMHHVYMHLCHWLSPSGHIKFGGSEHVHLFLMTLSSIAFACGFFIVVGLRLRPYESHRSSKFSLNSLPLSRYGTGVIYTTTCYIRRDIRSDVLSKIFHIP